MKYILFSIILISAISCTNNTPKNKESPYSAKPNMNFIGLYPGMNSEEYRHIKDSLLDIRDFEIIKTKDRYKNSRRRTFLSYSPSVNTFIHLDEIGRFFYAAVKITFWTFDDKLNDIEIILGHFSHKDSVFYNICEEEEIQALLELYQQKYGKPKILERGDDWMRLVGYFNPHTYLDINYNKEVYYWEENHLVLFFYVGSQIELEDKDLPPTTFNSVSSFIEWRSNPCILYAYKNEYKKKLIGEKQKKEKSILKDKI